MAKATSHVQNLPGGPLVSTAVAAPGGCAIYGAAVPVTAFTSASYTSFATSFDFPVASRSTINVQIAYTIQGGGNYTTVWYVNPPKNVVGTSLNPQLAGGGDNRIMTAVITRDPIATNGGKYSVWTAINNLQPGASGFILFTVIVGGDTESDDVTYF